MPSSRAWRVRGTRSSIPRILSTSDLLLRLLAGQALGEGQVLAQGGKGLLGEGAQGRVGALLRLLLELGDVLFVGLEHVVRVHAVELGAGEAGEHVPLALLVGRERLGER